MYFQKIHISVFFTISFHARIQSREDDLLNDHVQIKFVKLRKIKLKIR